MKKKLTATLAALLLFSGLSVSAIDRNKETLALIPTMNYETATPNRIWVGTFQLVWNDLMDGIVKGPVKFRGETPKVVKELNTQSFTKDYLSEDSYYTKFGETSPELRATIEDAIKEKFNETSNVLNAVDWTPGPNKLVAYAMLKKDFKFLTAFDKLKTERFGRNRAKVQYFGINKDSDKILDNTVHVMFYNSSRDFAVVIYTQTEDVLYLYRTNDNKTFDKLYSDMFVKRAKFSGNTDFAAKDELKIPNIGLYKEQSFDEVCGRQIKGTDMMLDKALETVDFKMDNEGVKLKSEAIIATKMSMPIVRNDKPRKFYFDDTFVMFLQEQGKNKPYFALRVNDVSTINKTERKK